MSGFAAWGLTVLGLAVVTTVAEMLLPSGKMRNVIRYVVATATVLVIVTPIPNLLRSGFDFELGFDPSVETDSDYLEYVDGVKRTLIETSTVEHLQSNGVFGVAIAVELDGEWNVKSATVDFSETVITGNGEHINKSEIIRLVADYLRIGEEAIMTYG